MYFIPFLMSVSISPYKSSKITLYTPLLWYPQSERLEHNITAGVIVSNQSLVLQQVVRAQAGRYSCQATNTMGLGSSNSLRLDVKC